LTKIELNGGRNIGHYYVMTLDPNKRQQQLKLKLCMRVQSGGSGLKILDRAGEKNFVFKVLIFLYQKRRKKNIGESLL
jgi:hypothetical protein